MQNYIIFHNKKMEKTFLFMDNLTILMKEGFSGERTIVLPAMVVELEEADPLVSSLYITDIGYYPHAVGHRRERREGIDQHVLIYCVEGAGRYRLDGRSYDVHSGEYFILPAGHPHAYTADDDNPWTIYWIHFKGQHAAVYAEGAHTPQRIRPAMNSRISERNHIFEEIFCTLNRAQDHESLRYASSLLHYYLASMRYLRHFREGHDPPFRTPADRPADMRLSRCLRTTGQDESLALRQQVHDLIDLLLQQFYLPFRQSG